MAYIMLLNLQLVLIFVCFNIKSFKKVVMRHLAMGSIIVYRTTIILNIPSKVVYCMEFRVVKG